MGWGGVGWGGLIGGAEQATHAGSDSGRTRSSDWASTSAIIVRPQLSLARTACRTSPLACVQQTSHHRAAVIMRALPSTVRCSRCTRPVFVSPLCPSRSLSTHSSPTPSSHSSSTLPRAPSSPPVPLIRPFSPSHFSTPSWSTLSLLPSPSHPPQPLPPPSSPTSAPSPFSPSPLRISSPPSPRRSPPPSSGSLSFNTSTPRRCSR